MNETCNVGIVTYYNVHNHGAVLQLYALEKVLERLGYSAKAAKFQRNYDYYEEGIARKYEISLKSIPYYLHYLVEKGLGKTLYNFNKRKLLNSFKQKNDMTTNKTEFDTLVVGSDEVFSIESGLTDAFWGGVYRYDRMISYAASAGTTDDAFIKSHCAEDWYSNAIQSFDAISVRDENTLFLVKEYGNESSNPVIVCDPVILYDFSTELASLSFSPKNRKPYLLIYSYDNNMNSPEEVSAIRSYAKKMGLQIISAGFYHRWCDKNVNCNPLQLLKIFDGCECVVTDTFHGSVMSLVTNTQFVAKVRGNGNKLRFLLEQYDCGSRIVENFFSLETDFSNTIDYAHVNNLLDAMRVKSLAWLKENME